MVTPRKSPLDVREYKAIELDNGLKIILVSSCDYGEPKRKKMAYSSKKCDCGNPKEKEKSTRCSDEKTKEFDRQNSAKDPTKGEEVIWTGSVGASLLENIVRLSNTKLNVFNQGATESYDVPTEDFPCKDHQNDFPDLTEKQKRMCCQNSRKYDMTASIAICVATGFFDDPPDLSGAAHLIEHLMFMGCSKYPKESYFDDFLEYTGGTSWNGNTDGQRTVYYFDTSSDYIEEVFEVVSAHFKSPLLASTCIAKERQNVDSEFRQALPIQMFRFNHFLQMLSTPGHPYNKFSWGNAETLSVKSDARVSDTLKESYAKYYSANNMFVAIQAPASVTELEDIVCRVFTDIPIRLCKRIPLNSLPMPFANPRFTKLYRVISTTQIRLLTVTWQLPPESWKSYETKPLLYIAYILMNENANGLPIYLREKGLLTDIKMNPTETNLERSDACAILSIHFYLTQKGLDQYEEVLEALFSFLKMVVKKGPQFRIFSELSNLKSMEFHYLGESDPLLRIKELSENMRIYPVEDVLSGPFLIRKYDKELINKITRLLKPELANYMLFSKEFKTLQNVTLSTEKYFKIKYHEQDFPPLLMDRLKNVKPFQTFCFCQPNPFITTNFCLVDPDDPNDIERIYPIRVIDTNYSPKAQAVHMWFFQEDNFVVPQATYCISISSPVAYESAHNAAMLDIFCAVFEDLFQGHAFSAITALLEFTVHTTTKGLFFRLAGFNDKLPLLVEKILEQFSSVESQTGKTRFQEFKMRMMEEYENRLLEPCTLSSDLKQSVITEQYWGLTCRYKACLDEDMMNIENFKIFIQSFTNKLHIRVYAGGNVNRTIATHLMTLISTKLNYEPLSMEDCPKNRVILLPLGERCAKIYSFSVDGDTSIIKSYFQIGPSSPFNRVICEYIIEKISEPLFNVLRTQKQLSYDPGIITRTYYGVLALQIHLVTQADKHDPNLVNKEIDDFLEKFYEMEIATLTEVKFNAVRKVYVESKATNIENIVGCEAEWEKVVLENIPFHYLEEEMNAWQLLKAKDIITFFRKYLLRPSYVKKSCPKFFETNNNCVEYRKLSIQVCGYKESERKRFKSLEPNYAELTFLKGNGSRKFQDDACFIQNIKQFHSNLYTFPPDF